jgi:3-deoxy-D-manno-octulosonic-acid transferase
MSFYDIAYAVGVTLAAPYWLLAPKARRKVLKALRLRMGRFSQIQRGPGPAVMIHAVSLGELNAIPALIRSLSESRADLQFIVTTTTDTGYARGVEIFANQPRVTFVRFPLDFSSAIKRLLDRFKPDVVVLMELEVWPNFMAQCRRHHIPVLVVNGRLTSDSYHGYRRVGFLTRGMFASLARVCAQDELYAQRFIDVGAPADCVSVTGTMKFDTAQVGDRVDGDEQLAAAVGVRPGREPIWVCGSTGPGEEVIILDAYRTLRSRHPALRLAIIPRKPERFDEVAKQIVDAGFTLVRRSRPEGDLPSDAIVLGDTMGELRKFYSLASVVFVGRSLVDLGARQHGSDMIEPAALGKPIAIGPFTYNFADAMHLFTGANAICVVEDPEELLAAIDASLNEPAKANEIGNRAREVVRQARGATARHAEIILQELDLHSIPRTIPPPNAPATRSNA